MPSRPGESELMARNPTASGLARSSTPPGRALLIGCELAGEALCTFSSFSSRVKRKLQSSIRWLPTGSTLTTQRPQLVRQKTTQLWLPAQHRQSHAGLCFFFCGVWWSWFAPSMKVPGDMVPCGKPKPVQCRARPARGRCVNAGVKNVSILFKPILWKKNYTTLL